MKRLLPLLGLLLLTSVFALPVKAQNPSTNSARLRVCQVKANVLQTRSQHLSQLVTTMEEKFDSIAARVEAYYTNTVVPSGKTVSNYDALVAEISTKKVAVQTALSTAQSGVANFSCDSTNPRGQMLTYRTDMQSVKAALKAYRTAIKNLIVAVHKV